MTADHLKKRNSEKFQLANEITVQKRKNSL